VFDSLIHMLSCILMRACKIRAKKVFQWNAKKLFFCGETVIGPSQRLLQIGPIESLTRVFFSTGCHMLMTCNVMRRVLLCDGSTDSAEAFVLGRLKGLTFKAFEFYANGEIVAVVAT
jgi:hypothetical protein